MRTKMNRHLLAMAGIGIFATACLGMITPAKAGLLDGMRGRLGSGGGASHGGLRPMPELPGGKAAPVRAHAGSRREPSRRFRRRRWWKPDADLLALGGAFLTRLAPPFV